MTQYGMVRFFQSAFGLSLLVALSMMMSLSLNWGISEAAAQGFRVQLGIPVEQGQVDDENSESGAVLKTDPDLEDVLATAERMRADGQFRVASTLWQAVLKQSGDALYSGDGETYFSLVRQVEAILAGLSQEGLTAYRVIADAEAKEILAQASGNTDVMALNDVVRNYFISSLGDDAAFKLGCIYLDRFDFIGARRMFEKIAHQYPDPSVPMDEVYARIALCQSYLGDLKSAAESIAKADEIRADSRLVNLVRESMGGLQASDREDRVHADWTMPMGNARRYGVMRSVPEKTMQNDLVAAWQFYFEPQDKYLRSADIEGAMLSGKRAAGERVRSTIDNSEAKLIKDWRAKSWRPAGELLIEGDRVFFKTGADLSVWSRSKIDQLAQGDVVGNDLSSAIAWRSVWRNAFEVDDATLMSLAMRKNWGGGRQRGRATGGLPEPSTAMEVNLFGDRIFQELSIHNNVAFSIEGKSFDERNRFPTKKLQAQWNTSYRRTRENFLTAYDATTGALKWTLPRAESESDQEGPVELEEESPWLESAGFMAAPIGFGDMIIVPVNQGGAISIYALDPSREGQTVWKSFLCDEPETGSVPWAAIDLAIEGSDLFVNCGMGVVFVLDPATGTVRFAKRYPRVGQADDFGRRNGWTVNRLNFDGWSNDVVIPYGRQMICFGSDTNTIEAFDRNTGKVIWRSEMNPIGFQVEYVLGVYDDMLYAAGLETIVAYDLKGEGRMVWGTEQLFDGKQSLGRGLVTPDGVYVPVEDSIYQYSLQGKNGQAELLAKVHVDLGTDAPVGNLYSDGDRFWVHGANRLYALANRDD